MGGGGGKGQSTIDFIYIWGSNKAAKLRWAGGAQRPVGRGNESKKTGARSARARTRDQNLLVQYIRKPFLIFDFASEPFRISFYMRKMFFYFLTVRMA
jgi:hypothetical protein